MFEVDAPGVHSSNVSTQDFLEAAAAYFALLNTVVKNTGLELRIYGAEVVDKCAAVRAKTTAPAVARVVVQSAQTILAHGEPPKGYAAHVTRLRAAMRAMVGHQARAWVGNVVLDLPIIHEQRSRAPFGTISLRATLTRVGGAEPKGRFTALGEDDFTLDLGTEAMAQRVAGSLYREADIVAQVSRDEAGSIDAGKLLEFEPVEDVAPQEASKRMRDWFRTSGIDWDLAMAIERDRVED